MKTRKALRSVVALALAGASGLAPAQERHEHDRGQGPGRPVPAHVAPVRGGPAFDARYHHDHYYPARGFVAATLPVGAISVGWHGGNYFFHGGVWWRPYGGRYIVVTPPVGILLPVLPTDYVTLWIGGAPYYYANGVYYTQVVGQGYEVVAPPPGADTAQPVTAPPPPPPAPDPIIYPRNGQSAAQTETDRRECDRWATTQPNAMADAHVFQRAVDACMDGRGYTVR
jgi:hypothetical protein